MIDPDRMLAMAQIFPAWLAAAGGLLGLLAGSYLATVFVRWPSGLSANHGRSRCDACGQQLRWFELVPVVSWLAMQGRCRRCREPIAGSHVAIEVLCGIAGAGAFAVGQPIAAIALWLLIVLAFFDAAYLWLPDRLVLPLALAAILAPAPFEDASIAWRLAGGGIGFAALWYIAEAFRRATGKIGLGGGDSKLFGAIGLWVGALHLPEVMILACAIGFCDAGRRALRGDPRATMRLPLGAFLSVATICLVILSAAFSLQPYRS